MKLENIREFQGTLIDQNSSKSLHTYNATRLHSRANKCQTKTYQVIPYLQDIPYLQQSKNTALSIKRQATQSHAKPLDTPRLTTGHFIALQREETQFHPPEHRHKLP